jgi:Domain of unknown function (DUF4157)
MGVLRSLRSERRTAPVANARLGGATTRSASPSPPGGTLLTWELAHVVVQPALKVGSTDDPLERDAEQFAGQACCGSETGGGSPCAECQQKVQEPLVQRRAHGRGPPRVSGAVDGLVLGPGRPLGATQRAFFEPRVGGDLGGVRVHTDGAAGRAAERLGARAFTLGRDIAFASGEYRPEAGEGQRLLAHEIAHVIQQRTAAPGALQRAPNDPEAPICVAEPQEEAPVCEPAPAAGQPATSPLSPVGTLDERVGRFKSLVRTTAIHRLMANQQNLAQWKQLTERVLPAGDLSALGLLQSGGSGAYLELQGIRDPLVRDVRANQVIGRYRACTGCHLENYAWGTRVEREALGGREWLPPTEQRGLPSGYRPTPGGAEERVHQLFPNPGLTLKAIERVRPVLAALGPDGYKVLPGTILADLEYGQFESVRTNIGTTIAGRSRDYGELIERIRSGSLGYEHFGPIIRDLLPTADPEVAREIQDEMDSHEFWSKVEMVVVGVMTLAALILAIYPPSSPVGLAWLGALEATLATYGAMTAPGMIAAGEAYSLSEGTKDIFSHQQQEAGGGMVLGGFLNIVMAPVGIASGFARAPAATLRMGQASVLSLRAGETLQQGKYLVTMAEDGSLIAAVADRPDMLIIVRNGEATAYQLTGTGGLRVLENSPILPGGAGPRGAGPRGGAYESPWPHVAQRQGNWCGAACGEMTAGRLGTEVTQEQIAAHRLFEEPILIEGKVFSAGGFHTKELATALEEVAPVAKRTWQGRSLVQEAVHEPSALRETMTSWIAKTESSVVVRVKAGQHWIVVDEVLPNGNIAIRDPGARTSAVITAEQLRGMGPTGDIVVSMPKD